MAKQTGSIDLKSAKASFDSSIEMLDNEIALRVAAEEQISGRVSDAEANISLKIDKVTDGTDLLSNINAVADQITLMASQINFGNNTVANELATLNSAVSIDTTPGNESIRVGASNDFYIMLTPTELGFYQGKGKVAYISNNQLYITQSVVLQQMDLGEMYDGVTGFGQWSWKVHKNGQSPSRNNLNLKWIG